MKKLLFLFIIIFAVTACKTKYIEVPRIHTEYIVRDSIRHDSISKIDSVYIRQIGDTIYIDKVHYLYRFLNLYKVDTIQRADTLTIVKTVEVEKKLSMLDRAYLAIGKNAVKVLMLSLIILVLYLLYKKLKL